MTIKGWLTGSHENYSKTGNVCQSNVSQHTIEDGSAAKDAEAKKRRKYEGFAEICLFELIAVENTAVKCPSKGILFSAHGSRFHVITDDPPISHGGSTNVSG